MATILVGLFATSFVPMASALPSQPNNEVDPCDEYGICAPAFDVVLDPQHDPYTIAAGEPDLYVGTVSIEIWNGPSIVVAGQGPSSPCDVWEERPLVTGCHEVFNPVGVNTGPLQPNQKALLCGIQGEAWVDADNDGRKDIQVPVTVVQPCSL